MKVITLKREEGNPSKFCFLFLINDSQYSHYSSNNYKNEEEAFQTMFKDLGQYIKEYYMWDEGIEDLKIVNDIDFTADK